MIPADIKSTEPSPDATGPSTTTRQTSGPPQDHASVETINPHTARFLGMIPMALGQVEPSPHLTAPTVEQLRTKGAVKARRVVMTVPPPPPLPKAQKRALESDVEQLPQIALLNATERRVFFDLVSLALEVASARGYAATPSMVVTHWPQELLALQLKISERHMRRVLGTLERLGLLVYKAHVVRVRFGDEKVDPEKRAARTGTLFAIKTRADDVAPRLRREDFDRPKRDMDAAAKSGETVKNLMSGTLPLSRVKEQLQPILRDWSLGIYNLVARCSSVAATAPSGDARVIVWQLPDLFGLHPAQLHEAVTSMARGLSVALSDLGSQRFYAGLLLKAVAAEHRGVRALGALASALERLLTADLPEWPDLRRPGALLVARLKACGAWDAWAGGGAGEARPVASPA